MGLVDGVAHGRKIGSGDPLPHVVVTVKEVSLLRGQPTQLSQGRLYLELPVAGNQSLEDFEEVFPQGTRLVVFLYDYTNPNDDNPISDPEAGRPTGSRLFAPHPQGLIQDYRGGLVSGLEHLEDMPSAWKKVKTVDQLIAAIGK